MRSTVTYADLVRYAIALGVQVYPIESCTIDRNRCLGSGAQMTVYPGTFLMGSRKQPAAFKVPRDLINVNTKARKISPVLANIRQELKLMIHLNRHPNIITFYGIAFDNLNPVLIVELAIKNLREYLEDEKDQDRRISWSTKARFCSEIASALDAMHSGNVIFGDLKGENVLVFAIPGSEAEVTAKISDFGYSAAAFSVAEGRLPGNTLRFRCPEFFDQTLKEWKGSKFGDIYSYGLVVWQIVNDGDEPFEDLDGEKIDEIKMKDRKLETLRESIPKDTPPEFWSIISDAVAYMPLERVPLTVLRKKLESLLDFSFNYARLEFETTAKEPIREVSNPQFYALQSLSVPAQLKERIFADYLQRAKEGDTESQFLLGSCFAEGYGVEEDSDLAIQWYTSAADAGNIDAKYSLTMCYCFGAGVEVNQTEGARWCQMAASGGHIPAQQLLGEFYEYGMGVPRDLEKAGTWYRESVKGDANFAPNLGNFYEKNPDKAVRWYKEQNGGMESVVGKYYLAVCLECGIGMKKDLEGAMKLYEDVAELIESKFGFDNKELQLFPSTNLRKHLGRLKVILGSSYDTPLERCQSIIGFNDEVYQCTTCSIRPAIYICMRCFYATDHTGHQSRYSHNRDLDKRCSCIDTKLWKTDIDCRLHNTFTEVAISGVKISTFSKPHRQVTSSISKQRPRTPSPNPSSAHHTPSFVVTSTATSNRRLPSIHHTLTAPMEDSLHDEHEDLRCIIS